MNIIHQRLLFTFLAMLAGLLLPDVFSELSSAQQDMLTQLPILLFVLVIILSHFFKQGRCGFAALVMIIAYYFIQTRLQTPLSVGTTRFEYYFLVLAIPISLLVFSVLPERSIFSVKGLWYNAFILWQGVAFHWFISSENNELVKHILLASEPWLFNTWEGSPLPMLLMAALVCTILVTSILLVFRNLSSDQAFLSALLAFSLTIIQFNQQWISASMFFMSALFLLFSVLHRSHEQAFIDELTLIPGRRAMNSDMNQLGGKYTIAMLDIDHFKKFNDTYGHDIGDNVLKMVATQLSKVKGRGKVYRYGGEEFTVLFKGKSAEDCVDYLEQLRLLVADYPFRIRDHGVRPDDESDGSKQRSQQNLAKVVQVTISIGVAERSSEASLPTEVIKVADGLLYEAKKKGRNRVCF
ncbi:MAG: GGDEF domain-containing protein [Moritella sp.]|jgi:GGDEF domain-containing protein